MANLNDIAGKIIIYSVSGLPKQGIAYSTFDHIAEFCSSNPNNPLNESYGMPRDYMPQEGEEIAHAQNSWALGTGDFPSKGALFNPGQAVKDFYFAKYDVEPTFRVRVVRLKKQAGSDVVKRHLYLDVFTATGVSDTEDMPDDLSAIDSSDKVKASQAAAKQLTSNPIILMEFKIEETGKGDELVRTPIMRFAPTETVDAAIMPAVMLLIEQMKEKVRMAKNNANDQSIRAGVRRWLYDSSCFAVRGSGGNYFIPMQAQKIDPETGKVARHSTDEKIEGLTCFFDELSDYCDRFYAAHPQVNDDGDRPEVMVLDAYLNAKGSLHSKRTTDALMGKAAEAINDRLTNALEDVAPVLAGRLGDKAAAKRIRAADLEVLQIYRDLDSYRSAFQSKFEQLDEKIELADERLEEARKMI